MKKYRIKIWYRGTEFVGDWNEGDNGKTKLKGIVEDALRLERGFQLPLRNDIQYFSYDVLKLSVIELEYEF